MDPQTFEELSPSRFISFAFPNPAHLITATKYAPYSSHPLLRVAVLDSPISRPSHPATAAMLVPVGRKDDWIFSTEAGHLHLLLSSSFSRLILIGERPSGSDPRPYTRPPSDPDPDPLTQFQRSLLPLLLALSPRSAFDSGTPEIPFISYDDGGVLRIVPVDILVGPTVGEMLVEDVEFDGGERRRRLRFKRMPNLVQGQVRLLCRSHPEAGSLLQPYLGPMVAGLSLWAPRSGSPPPRALCLGVGGGDLLMCLRHRLGFSVIGVEVDKVVLSAAKRYFGLIEGEALTTIIGDAIKLLADGEILGGFDVIMVDLDSSNALDGVSAPPLEFVSRSILLSVRSALDDGGIVVVNVMSPDECFYEGLVDSLREVFVELYEIDVGNGENFVVVAAAAPVRSARNEKEERFEELKQVGVERFVGCIRKI